MITVFGSINTDIAVRIERPPRTGETVLGDGVLLSPGGKGANQAHAARLFGVPTALYGAVGDDVFSSVALSCLTQAGVDLAGVARLRGQPTGMAMITVDQQGDNAIIVVPGANEAARAAQVPDHALQQSRVLLLQLEVPSRECFALAARARRFGCMVILNASPLPAGLGLEVGAIDVLIVNRLELSEVAARLGLPRQSGSNVQACAAAVAQSLGLDVLVTLGADGCLLAQGDGKMHSCPAARMPVVDTTGAGDTFAGVFAAAIAGGLPGAGAMRAASIAAGLACTRAGTQIAQPRRQRIDAELAAWTGAFSPAGHPGHDKE